MSVHRAWHGYGVGNLSRAPRVPSLNGCVGAWDIGEMENGVVEDQSGYGHSGAVHGNLQKVSCELGNAGLFDGSSSYVDISAGWETAVNTSDEFSFVAVFYLKEITSTERVISSDESTNLAVVKSADDLYLYLKTGDHVWGSVSIASVLKVGWQHLVVQYTSGTVNLWLNGTLVKTDTSYTGGLSFSNNSLVVGSNSALSGYWKNDKIKSVQLYDYFLSAEQIAADYHDFSHTITFASFPEDWVVSLTNEGGAKGQRLSNTSWLFGDSTGRWKVVDDDTYGKRIECVTDGALMRPEARGDGGTLAIRRDSSKWTLMRDSAGITTLNLLAGDKIAFEHNTLKPIYQEDRLFSWSAENVASFTSTISVTGGVGYWINYGDGTVVAFTGTGANQSYTHTYAVTGTYTVTFGTGESVALIYFRVSSNQLIGNIPYLSSNTALSTFYVYNNQLTGSIPDLSNNTVLRIFYAFTNQLTGSIPDLSSNTLLVDFRVHYNQLTGSIPDLSNNAVLEKFFIYNNQLTGSIPNLSSNTALHYFYAYSNQLTGSIPDLSSNIALQYFSVHVNLLSGSIPDLSNNNALVQFQVSSNQLTGYTASIISTTCINFQVNVNKLSVSAVDQILTDFTTGAAGRPASGTINVSNQTPAAPPTPSVLSAAQAALPGWSITTD